MLVIGGAKTPIRTAWVLDGVREASLDVSKRTITAADRRGRIHYLRGTAKLRTAERPVLEVRQTNGPVAFGLSDETFAFEPFDPADQHLHFRDSAGPLPSPFGRDVRPAGKSQS